MENIKTATQYLFVETDLSTTRIYFLSHPLTWGDGNATHYAMATARTAESMAPVAFLLDEEMASDHVEVRPCSVEGKVLGTPAMWAYGTLDHNKAMVQLGYTLTAPLVPSKPKTKRTPARTHLNVADIDRETGKPVGRKPACGQLNGTRTDRAQTHYTHDTAEVTCQRCVTTKLFAKAVADEFHAIDRKAYFDTLTDHKDVLEEFEKRQFEALLGPGSWETRGQACGNTELARVHEEVRAEVQAPIAAAYAEIMADSIARLEGGAQ